jgi:uncharacterized membrane protein
MTANTTAGPTGASSRTVYFGLWALAAVAFVGLQVAGQLVLAAVAFLFLGGAATVYRTTGDVRFDERDRTVGGIAAARAVRAFGIGAAILFPSLTAAVGLDYVEWTPFLSGVSATVTVFFVLWAATVLAVKRRW